MNARLQKAHDHIVELLHDRDFRLVVFLFPMYFAIIFARLLYAITQYSIIVSGVHIHHFSYGIVFVIISGIALIFFDEKKWVFAIPAFGFGVGLVVDEFSYVVFNSDVGYYSEITLMSIVFFAVFITYLARRFHRKAKR